MLDGHNAQVAALIADVADIPPHLLERAIAEHVRSSEFMPKAASLIAKCKSYLAPKVVDSDEAEKWKRRVREGNRMLIRDNLWERSHWALNHNGIGCSLVAGRMEPQAYNEALTVDVAILPKRAA